MTELLTPLDRPATTADRVVESIREAIVAGRLRPGDVLVERRLAEQLGVSKTPVREALISLEAAGLVQVTSSRGATVRTVDIADIRQAYEVRVLLEPWAVARTVRAGGGGPVAAARTALRTARTHLSGADRVPLSLANRRFHRALYAGCGNPIVVSQLDALGDLAALGAVSVLWERGPSWRQEYAAHEEIQSAATAGDADLAERLTRRHIRESLRHLGTTQTTVTR